MVDCGRFRNLTGVRIFTYIDNRFCQVFISITMKIANSCHNRPQSIVAALTRAIFVIAVLCPNHYVRLLASAQRNVQVPQSRNEGFGRTIPAYTRDPDNIENLRTQSRFRAVGMNEFAEVMHEVEVNGGDGVDIPVEWLRLSGFTGFADFVEYWYKLWVNIFLIMAGQEDVNSPRYEWREVNNAWNWLQPRQNVTRPAAVLRGYREGPMT